jgi:predicted nucleic acid-binding protein
MLDIIPPRSKIFIDSNILIYHFLDLSESCSILLERVEHGEVQAYISTVVQAEVLHRLMISEAVDKFGIKPNQAVRYLKEHPRAIASLNICEIALADILEFNIEVICMGREAIIKSQNLRKYYGLMTNDSLNLYAMKKEGLRIIATNDRDFERVDGIEVWRPDV